jgi:adenylate kinase
MTNVVILIGPTGSGKSVQAEALLMIHPDWHHISSGDLLRDDLAATSFIARGELVPSAEVERVVAGSIMAVSSVPCILLDGFPRSLAQAQWLDDIFITTAMTIKAVFSFETTKEVILKRLAERHRADDVTTIVARKWAVYRDEVRPVCAYYDQHGLLSPLDANLPVSELTNNIEEILHV